MKALLCKVYGAFFPVDATLGEALAKACASAIGNEEEWLFQEGDMLRLSFEGVYFPLDDCLRTLLAGFGPGVAGKLDYLDLDQWTLTRHIYESTTEAAHRSGNSGSQFVVSTRSLNHVLDYSGH